MNSKLKVIFFDVGNTLLFPNRERIHAPLAERGIVPDGEHLRDLECRTKNRFDGINWDDDQERQHRPQFLVDVLLPTCSPRSDLRTTPSATNSSPASGIPATGTRFAPAPPNNCTRSASATGSQ